MKILVQVNQAAALRRGIDAPSSVVDLDVDPSALTQDQRDVLASTLEDGYRATRLVWASSRNYNSVRLTLDEPTLAGLIIVIDGILAERAAVRAAEQKAADSWCAAVLAEEPVTREVTVSVNLDGRELTYCAVASATEAYDRVPVPDRPMGVRDEDCSAEVLALVAERATANQSAWSAAHEAALAAARAKLPAIRAAQDAAEAAETAERAANTARLVGQLNPGTVARRAGGYCSDSEWRDALAGLATAELREQVQAEGLDTRSPRYIGGKETTSLTNAQFAALGPVQAAAEKLGCTVTVKKVYDSRTEETCAEHDEVDEDCDDCNVEYSGARAVAVLSRDTRTDVGLVEASIRVELGRY